MAAGMALEVAARIHCQSASVEASIRDLIGLEVERQMLEKERRRVLKGGLNILFTTLLALPLVASAVSDFGPDTRSSLDKYLEQTARTHGIAGYSAAVLKNGRMVYSGEGGLASVELGVPVTEETVFQVFSVAKLFVNVTVMQLVESGKADLDEPIREYLPQLPANWGKITIRQAMTHSTGLPDYYRWPNPTPSTISDALNSVSDLPFEFATGTGTRYNQTNYLLLRLLIEKIAGEDFLSVVTKQMIASAELRSTQYAGEFAVVPRRATMYQTTPEGLARNVCIDQPDYMFASSGLNSTASDLAHWFAMLLDERFVSADTMASMWTPSLLENGLIASFTHGWEYRREDEMTIVGHGGGNRADVRHFMRDDGESVTVVFLSNGSARSFWPGSVSNGLARIVFGISE